MRKKFSIPGVSFSWKRAIGISKLRARISREIGIPTTRSGLERKVGAKIVRAIMSVLFGCSR